MIKIRSHAVFFFFSEILSVLSIAREFRCEGRTAGGGEIYRYQGADSPSDIIKECYRNTVNEGWYCRRIAVRVATKGGGGGEKG